MADKPIIFAMANPDAEITPEEVAAVRDDAIMATGRSDYPNQYEGCLQSFAPAPPPSSRTTTG